VYAFVDIGSRESFVPTNYPKRAPARILNRAAYDATRAGAQLEAEQRAWKASQQPR
jgi:hypothetical protein